MDMMDGGCDYDPNQPVIIDPATCKPLRYARFRIMMYDFYDQLRRREVGLLKPYSLKNEFIDHLKAKLGSEIIKYKLLRWSAVTLPNATASIYLHNDDEHILQFLLDKRCFQETCVGEDFAYERFM